MNIKTESRVCVLCGKEFEDNFTSSKHKYCSVACRNRAAQIQQGHCASAELVKTCTICGKEFRTWQVHKVTCSPECSRIRGNRHRPILTEEQKQRRKEYDREKWLRSHPDARTREEISAGARAREAAKEQDRERREAEKLRALAEKEAKKQANIDHWQYYESEHECEVCGKMFIAHYPTTKYCSKVCARKNNRTRHRYKEITIDRGITLPKLAKRDHNQCQICGLFVDWNDYIKTNKTVICGEMYPSIDHIRPLSLGGVHSWQNVQLAHRKCNTGKSNKYIG